MFRKFHYIYNFLIPSSPHPVWVSGKGVTKQGTYSPPTQNIFCSSRIIVSCVLVDLTSISVQEVVHLIFAVKYFVYSLAVRLVLLDLSLLLFLSFLSRVVFIFSFGLLLYTLLFVRLFFCCFLKMHTWCIFNFSPLALKTSCLLLRATFSKSC